MAVIGLDCPLKAYIVASFTKSMQTCVASGSRKSARLAELVNYNDSTQTIAAMTYVHVHE